MGFGLLFIGYLITFLIYLTVHALGVGSLALLAGYSMMFFALGKLSLYCKAFASARWTLVPLAITALYRLVQDASTLFLLNVPFTTGTVANVARWAEFFLVSIFQFSLLYGIRVLAVNVGIRSIEAAALRDNFAYGIYACLFIAGNLSFTDGIRGYLTPSTFVFNILWVLLILFLIINCAKSICPAGDEEITPRRSRFEWINRLGDAYERTQTRMKDQAKQDGEEFRRRHEERKKRKKHKK